MKKIILIALFSMPLLQAAEQTNKQSSHTAERLAWMAASGTSACVAGGAFAVAAASQLALMVYPVIMCIDRGRNNRVGDDIGELFAMEGISLVTGIGCSCYSVYALWKALHIKEEQEKHVTNDIPKALSAEEIKRCLEIMRFLEKNKEAAEQNRGRAHEPGEKIK